MTDILIVEDDTDLGALLRSFISSAGYSTVLVYTAEEALALLPGESFRLALLDIMLPLRSGYEVARAIREKGDIPILLMSARADESSMLLGYETGADDFIEKPFSTTVLLAKIKAMLKRGGNRENVSDILSGFGIELNISARTVTKNGKPVQLNAKEFDLLKCLMEHSGEALDKNRLFNEVWGSDCVTEPSTVIVHIRWLREKIEEDPKNPTIINTVYKIGYRFGDAKGGC
ncbi:MAG: response regulator transcription factor [Clostridiales bacterium]|nr:response regulator transcription factor [Clostridiales bacterium]